MKKVELFLFGLGLRDPWFVERVEFVAEEGTLVNQLFMRINHKPCLMSLSFDGREFLVFELVERTSRHFDLYQHNWFLDGQVKIVKNRDANTDHVLVINTNNEKI